MNTTTITVRPVQYSPSYATNGGTVTTTRVGAGYYVVSGTDGLHTLTMVAPSLELATHCEGELIHFIKRTKPAEKIAPPHRCYWEL